MLFVFSWGMPLTATAQSTFDKRALCNFGGLPGRNTCKSSRALCLPPVEYLRAKSLSLDGQHQHAGVRPHVRPPGWLAFGEDEFRDLPETNVLQETDQRILGQPD